MTTRDQLEDMADLLKRKALDRTLTEPDVLFATAAAQIHIAMVLCDIREELEAIRKNAR
jgi:hypothetical protein